MSSDSKKEKDLNTQLKKLYITNKDNIISWLDRPYTYILKIRRHYLKL